MIPGEYQLAEGDIIPMLAEKTIKNRSNQFRRPSNSSWLALPFFLKPIMPLNLTAL